MRPDASALAGRGAPAQVTGALGDLLVPLESLLPGADAYVYGSLARGAYRPPASDVDVLIVTSAGVSDETFMEIHRLLAAARSEGARIDAVVATSDQVSSSELPVRLEAVFPADAEPQREPGNRGMMFPLDRQDVWDCGVALLGRPAREVVRATPTDVLRASLRWVFPHLAVHFKNPELMLCRAAHAFVEGRLCSKPEAARWSLERLDARWHGLVRRALARWEKAETQAACSAEELAGFQSACADVIEAATGMRIENGS